jgi:hypothetical protein
VQDLERQVGAMRRTRDHDRIAQTEEADDVLAHMRRRRGGQPHDRRRAERAQALAELQVGGAEIVAPLGNAVRFVDRGETEAALAQRRLPLFGAQRLRRGHHQQRAAARNLFERLAPRLAAHRAVEANDRNLALEQLLVLIAQQRQQRRDQHHRLGQDHGRNLVAGGFPKASRQNHQQVLAVHGVGDHLLLLGL